MHGLGLVTFTVEQTPIKHKTEVPERTLTRYTGFCQRDWELWGRKACGFKAQIHNSGKVSQRIRIMSVYDFGEPKSQSHK